MKRTSPFSYCGALLVIGLLIFAGGCVTTTQPILLDNQVVADNTFIGKWATDDARNKVAITAGADEKTYALVYTDDKEKKGSFTARFGKIDTLLVMKLSPADPAPDASDVYKAQLLPLYSFYILDKKTPDQISLRVMKSEWLKKYNSDHPGELAMMTGSPDRMIVTAATADFQAFLKKHVGDEGVFGDPAIFNRVAEAPAK
ncbi:MAG TPA: hypothetical protein VFE47_09980 [Tepidisphaeraceae bacterium]|jgi:hypothetical protein|nr:hypothetical protein [Tepidisphaeraceae bacterium]